MIPEQTDRDPYARVKPLGKEPEPSRSGAEAERIKEMLKEHTAFRNSPMGKAALAIAHSEIVRLQQYLDAPIEVFLEKRDGLSIYVINEMRAQARGAIGVWNKVLYEPEFLVARKVELEEKNKNKS